MATTACSYDHCLYGSDKADVSDEPLDGVCSTKECKQKFHSVCYVHAEVNANWQLATFEICGKCASVREAEISRDEYEAWSEEFEIGY